MVFCPYCDTQNPEDYIFCGKCGARLPVPEGGRAAPPPAPAPRQSRRSGFTLVSVLFGAVYCLLFTTNFMTTGGLNQPTDVALSANTYLLLLAGLTFVGSLLGLIAFFNRSPACARWSAICYTVAFAVFVLLGSIAYLIIPILGLLSLALYAPPVVFGWIGYARARRQSDD